MELNWARLRKRVVSAVVTVVVAELIREYKLSQAGR